MYKKLKELLMNAHSPYSKIKVAAIVTTIDGKVFNGVNVENASYGGTICAERSALTAAITGGMKKGELKSIDLTSNLKHELPPCGICRQFIIEFATDETIVTTWVNGKSKTYRAFDLLPNPVTMETL